MSKLKRRFVTVLLLFIVASTSYLFGWSQVFTVKSIAFTGVNAAEEELVIKRIQYQPAVVQIGAPLARVDKRVVSNRISELNWIKSVSVKRNWISKAIQIGIAKRTPIAVIKNSGGRTFVDDQMEIFIIPTDGQLPSEMANLPELILNDRSPLSLAAFDQLHRGISAVEPAQINAKEMTVQSYLVNSPAYLLTTLVIDGRSLKITWGGSQDLPLKIKVLRELLLLPENAKIVRMDLTTPLSPIVK